MKSLLQLVAFVFLVTITGLFSCKKDHSCENCQSDTTPANRLPIADAGPDQTTVLPSDSVLLDGSASTDPDGSIVGYRWRSIAGPGSATIAHPDLARAIAHQLVPGNYRFELTVTDDKGSSAKDTMQVIVNAVTVFSCVAENRTQLTGDLVFMARLSQRRMFITTVSADHKVFFAGGRTKPDGNNGSSRVDIYDRNTHSWSIAELSKPRYAVAAVAAGGKVFFAGGMVGGGPGIHEADLVATVDIYDMATDTWSVASLSKPRTHIAAATVGNKVFFAGGMEDWRPSHITPSTTVDIYDLSTNTWSVAHLSEARGGISAITVHGKIYFAGGQLEGWYREGSDRIDIYDHTTRSWSAASLQRPMGFIGGVVMGDNIYWASGCYVEIKNVITGNSSTAYLAHPKGWVNTLGENIVVKGHKIIFYDHKQTGGARFDVYNTDTHTWSVGEGPRKNETPSIVAIGDTIYLAGGWENMDIISDVIFRLEF